MSLMRLGAPSSAVCLRAMRSDDIDTVLGIQREAYADGYQESAEVLGRKLSLAPGACWLAEREGRGLAYIIAHPWSDNAPPLHAAIERLPVGAEYGFVHELAVSARARGAGVGAGLFAKVQTWAQHCGLRGLRLVALADARAYWCGLGFVATPTPLPAAYGAGAVFMRRN